VASLPVVPASVGVDLLLLWSLVKGPNG
jgi:hypothetical protein